MASNIKTPGITAITIIIITILLSQSAFSISQEIKDPANIGELKVKITQYGKIIVPSGKIEWAKINLTFPQDNTNQEVMTGEKYSEDELGNNILTIKKEKPGNIITYSAESIVTIKERRTLYIPETYIVPGDIKTYLEPTENIQSDNQKIENLATELTKDSKTDFERIAKLATWVHDNVEYTLSLGTEAKDALWTLDNKVGTCDEFASLFIALARAAGYPARYISGHAYGKSGWEKHAFAEVYLGRWIPVDPTWNEVGNLDATHIQFTTKKDNIVKNEIQVYGTKISDMDWAEDETDIEILDIMEKEKENDYELIKSADMLQAGEEAAVILRFTPKEYKVVKLDLEPCISTMDIVTIEDKEKSVILEPDKEKIVYWKIKVSDDLKKNMEYTCPLTLNSRLLSTRAINMTINTLVNQKPDEVTLYTELDKTDLILGEQQTIKIDIVMTQGSNPITIGIIHDNEHIEKTLTLSPHETAKISHTFIPLETGEHEILVYTSTGTIQTTTYKVGKNGDIYIDKIEIPGYAKINEEIPISIHIKNNRNTTETIKFTTASEKNTDMISTRIEKEIYINTTATYSDTGDKKLSFHLSGENMDTRTTRNIRIYEKPEIELKTTYDYKKNIATLYIESAKDIPKDISIEINGITKHIDDPKIKTSVEFDLPIGTHTATIRYTDVGDNKYTKNSTVVIKEQTTLEKIIAFVREMIGKIIG